MTYYCLSDIQESHGYHNDKVLFTLTWFDVYTLEIFQTTVDPTYRNFTSSGWNRIIKDASPWGVYTDLKRTGKTNKQHRQIISADSRPVKTEDLTLDEISRYAKYQAQQLIINKPVETIHRGLFELK